MGTFMAATKKWLTIRVTMDGAIFVTTKRVAIDVAMFLAATKRVALDGVIFWPQLKGWLWMGLFSSRN